MSRLPFAPGDDEYDHTAAGMVVGLAYGVKRIAYTAVAVAVLTAIYIGFKLF